MFPSPAAYFASLCASRISGHGAQGRKSYTYPEIQYIERTFMKYIMGQRKIGKS